MTSNGTLGIYMLARSRRPVPALIHRDPPHNQTPRTAAQTGAPQGETA